MIGESSRIMVNTKELTFHSLKEKDFGKYRCSAAVGEHFETLTSEAYILKKDVPHIINSDENTYHYGQGDDGVISCKVNSVPAPTQTIWSKGRDNEIIDVSGRRYSMHKETRRGGLTITLSIKDLASTDFDIYNCTVINERGMDSAIFALQQKASPQVDTQDDFPWKLGIGAGVIVVAIIAVVVVFKCRRNKTKTSSAGSLSVVSNTTDNSIKKPTDVEHAEESSLPEYGMRPIDRWKNNEEPTDSSVFDTDSYCHERKPELYGSFNPLAGSSFNPPSSAFPPGNYGSYRVQQPHLHSMAAPPYSTLPIRPAKMHPDAFNRSPYVGSDDGFPDPPELGAIAEHRLATNV